MMVALGCAIAWLDYWSLFEGIYFAFVAGLTIGYGDLVPKSALPRMLAITIGFIGILLTGLVAAVGVQVLHAAGATSSLNHAGERRRFERPISADLQFARLADAHTLAGLARDRLSPSNGKLLRKHSARRPSSHFDLSPRFLY